VRTALSFIAFGFVVARFALFAREIVAVEHVAPNSVTTVSTWLGVAMTLCGIAVGIYGAQRYAAQDRALRKGGDGAMTVNGAIFTTVAVVIFGVIIAVDLIRLR
jgi:uncharacterized membrane protein YidH (DUF202 family)